MKRIILLSISLINFIFLFSNPINTEIAKKVAKNFMDKKRYSSNGILNLVTEKLNGETSFYVVSFQEGGWVMVSSDNSTVPVLGYSFNGIYKIEDQKPEAFIEWINGYKEQILTSSKLKATNIEILQKWEELLENKSQKSLITYTPGTSLLNVPGRGEVIWNQDYNNDGGCTPSYHKYCPSGTGNLCFCDRKSTGCGAVAMGQIMWYWQWPISTSYRTYNWNLMPTELNYSSTTPEEDEIANLLRDIGRPDATDMTYWCSGTWTTVNKVEDAFINMFNYKGVKKHVKKYWEYGDAWQDLIRSEIDTERPVFYRGDKSDLSTSKHMFVLDGYDAADPDFFHINWGWAGSYNNYFTLEDLTPGSHNYNKNQMAIVGISPTIDEIIPPVNITDVPYTSVTGVKIEVAQQNISLPLSGKILSVENGGELTLIAGNTITLNPGFQANAGSEFTADINSNYTVEMDISVPNWIDAFTPNGDGINDELCIYVENANSWEFEAFDSDGRAIFQSAGTIIGNRACVWDGSGAYCMNAYPCIIRFKNNYGRSVENAYMVTVICGSKSTNANAGDLLLGNSESKTTTIDSPSLFSPEIEIYPNPNNGIFYLKSFNSLPDNIVIYNSFGQVLFEKNKISSYVYQINLGELPKGIYFVKVKIDNQLIIRKIILN